MGGSSTKLSTKEACARHKSPKPCRKEEGCTWAYKSLESNEQTCQMNCPYCHLRAIDDIRAIFDAISDNKWE